MTKILVVEDEAHLLFLLQQIIEDLGHEVFTATNGREALVVVERERPDLVLSDVMMPLMDGYHLLENIKVHDQWESIKVVLISAAPINQQRQPSADAYVNKPYNIDYIEDLIDRLITTNYASD